MNLVLDGAVSVSESGPTGVTTGIPSEGAHALWLGGDAVDVLQDLSGLPCPTQERTGP